MRALAAARHLLFALIVALNGLAVYIVTHAALATYWPQEPVKAFAVGWVASLPFTIAVGVGGRALYVRENENCEDTDQ